MHNFNTFQVSKYFININDINKNGERNLMGSGGNSDLARVRLRESQNPFVGMGQKGPSWTKLIFKLFCELNPLRTTEEQHSPRTATSCWTKTDKVITDILTFRSPLRLTNSCSPTVVN